jgi:hypothetical protein
MDAQLVVARADKPANIANYDRAVTVTPEDYVP